MLTDIIGLHPRVDEASGVVYYPAHDGWALGFRAVHPDGRTEFLYLNPSVSTDDPSSPDVFLYQGPAGDPSSDTPHHHYTVLERPEDEPSLPPLWGGARPADRA